MSQLKVGDTVKLRSGGPVMTITHMGHAAGYPGSHLFLTETRCQWFDANNYPNDIRCESSALALVAPHDPSPDEHDPTEQVQPTDRSVDSAGIRTAEFRHWPKSEGGDM